MLPDFAQNELQEALQQTSNNTGLNLVMALSYSSRWEIVNAVQLLAKDAKEGKIELSDISHQTFNNYLCTKNIPDPELIIRTSGEFRISNFLLYQLAYSELYFTNTRWPEFRKQNLYEAILDFQGRERRYGKTGNQIKQETEI